ncbi:MAG TPA: TRAP transporter large permease [Rectinemataceae bacterium]|nr:TRAP transporter large permease [Rectinemataceae bacterium]
MWEALIAFAIFILIGVPVAFSLGAAATVYFVIKGVSLSLIATRLFTGLDSFTFMAIPFFVLAGELMNSSGITKRLVAFTSVFVGRLRGGLGHVSVVTSMLFGGVTGSAIADTSAVGVMMIPAMKKAGYDEEFSAGLIASAGVMGPIIPPSIPFVVYSLLSSTSVAALFLGGVVPGVMIAIGLMIATYVIARRRNFPRGEKVTSIRQVLLALLNGIIPLMMPFIILGGIIAGIFTATEASAVAVIYGLVVGILVYRDLPLSAIKTAFLATAKTTGVVFLVIACSNVFNWMLVVEQVPQAMATFVGTFIHSKAMILLAINIVLLFVGTFMEGTAAMIILVPILLKITAIYAINPVFLGIVVVLNLMIGLLTPPVGLLLYVVCGMTKMSLERVVKGVLPFLFVEVVVLFLVTYIEPLSMFLPRYFGYIH